MKFVFAMHGWYLGGFATFCRNLAAGLQQRGHEVSLLVLPDARQKVQFLPGWFQHCEVLPRGLGRLSVHVAKVVRAIDRLEPEVLVLNDCAYGMAALPFISRSILRLPVVHSISRDEVELALSQEGWWDRVLAVSDAVCQAVAARGMGARVSLCPLGVPLPSRQRQCSKGGHPIRLISVSRVVVHQKRIDRLPAIARILAQQAVPFQWTVLGDGEYLPRLRRELRRLGLAERFRLKGAVATPEVLKALQVADVFVLTSDCEGMPQALLEAMAHAVVPVVSRIPGSTTSLIDDGKSGYLCEPTEAAAFAGAIACLARGPELRTEMGNRAAGRVAQEFSLDSFSERFLRVMAESRAQAQRRRAPLPLSAHLGAEPAFRCLGFWRSLRHQSLGRLKQWLLARPGALFNPGG